MTYRAPPGPSPLAIVAIGSHVFGMDRRTGRRTNWTRIAIDAERAVVGGGHELASLAYGTGALLWQDGFRGFGLNAVALGFPGKAAQVDLTG